MENQLRRNELMSSGFTCSQILLLMGLESIGKKNPDLIRSMHALTGGIGFTGHLCGALSGGACLLGLYAGKGEADEELDERLFIMVGDLVDWYKEEYGMKYGGIDCNQILGGNLSNYPIRCPEIIDSIYQKVKELLVENGFDLNRN